MSQIMHCMPEDSRMNCLQWIFQSVLQANIVHNPLEFAAFFNSFNCDECEAEDATVLIRMKNILEPCWLLADICVLYLFIYLSVMILDNEHVDAHFHQFLKCPITFAIIYSSTKWHGVRKWRSFFYYTMLFLLSCNRSKKKKKAQV